MVLAMIDEKLEKRIEKKWMPLVEEQGDLIELLIKIIKDTKSWDLTNGCPLEREKEKRELKKKKEK